MKISIIGSGVFGISIAKKIASNGYKITMWSSKENTKSIIVPDNVTITNDIKEATCNMDIIFMMTGAKYYSETLKLMKPYYKDSLIVIGSKGLDESGTTLYELSSNILNTDNISVLYGPTLAIDVKNLEPLGFTLASKNSSDLALISPLFKNDKIEYTSDYIGVSLCGVLKNIYAIGSGILEGMGYGISTRGLYLCEALKEMKQIFKELNLEEDTIYKYAGLGDLFLTSSTPSSRNYTLGIFIGLGDNKTMSSFLKKNTVEGYDNLKIFCENYKDIDTKIIKTIFNIINNSTKKEDLITLLH